MLKFFAEYWWQQLLVAVISYLVGSVNFALLFSKAIKHKDIRQVGSGNAGTTNVFRVYGLRMGALTFLFDALKGVAACLACFFIFKYTHRALDFEYWAGIFVVLGHVFPVYYRLRGGKGVATSIGVCFVLHPILMLCCVLPICIIIFVTDRMSVMSLLFSAFMITWHWTVLREDVGIVACVFLTIMFVIVILAHGPNIVRIVTGKEVRTGVRRKVLRKDKRELRLQREAEAAARLAAEQAQTEPDGVQSHVPIEDMTERDSKE